MRWFRAVIIPVSLGALAACASETGSTANTNASRRTIGIQDPADASQPAFDRESGGGTGHQREIEAEGRYEFFVPADFNGGIFGGSVDNDVVFEAHRSASGVARGHFHYVQTFNGVPATYAGRVTCLSIYDTPVLARWPNIPAMVQNRAKWGGIIDYSTDPTTPVGTYLWFQSIDNSGRGNHNRRYPDLSTLSGFGDKAATDAFCATDKVPNSNFGPHAVHRGDIDVR